MSMYACLVLWAVAISSVYAENDESGSNEEFEMVRGECLKQYELTDEDIDAVMKTGDVSRINSCYWACYYKKIGFINAEGQYDLDNYLTTIRKFSKNEYFAALEKLGRRCEPVKDEAVTDGEAGCERGALLAACFMVRED